MITEIGKVLWPLDSGTWEPNPKGEGFKLHHTANNLPRSEELPDKDLWALLQVSLLGTVCAEDAPTEIFPPEFKYSPISGTRLKVQHKTQPQIGWLPPYGAAPLEKRASGTVRGLRQTTIPIKLSAPEPHNHDRITSVKPVRNANDDPDDTLELPPPGDYEYFTTPAGSCIPVLMALDPGKGLLFLLLPVSKRWVLLKSIGGQLAESLCVREKWQCEVAIDGLISRIFLPTKSGLACLTPDAANLSFTVHYIGDTPAIGAPLQFGENVWAPLRLPNGGVRFVSADTCGKAAESVDLPSASLGGLELGALHPPLTDGRKVLWLCDAGQLLLRYQASGALDGSFLPWPNGIKPSFEFGSPYLSRDGSLWQLCFDTQRHIFTYLKLGTTQHEIGRDVLSPRLCSGSFNFRFDIKNKKDPWLEPEHGDDGGTDNVVLPLLESTVNDAVLGLKLETTAALADLLCSDARMRAELVLDDKSSQTTFYNIIVAEPWRLRFFVYAGKLWAYHPNLNRLDGWTLQI